MKKVSKRRLLLSFLISFLGFFFLSGLTMSISFRIFMYDLNLSDDYVHTFAPYTLINLILISAIFGLIATAWKKLTVEIPIEEINKVLHRIKKGDFSSKLNRRLFTSRYSTIVNNINLMTDELASLDSLKVSLMSNISHEFKTPISVISNYATLLSEDNIDDEKRIEYANAILGSSKKMTELVTNILKLNQLENQNIPSEIQTFDIGEQICASLLDFEDVWEEKNIDVVTEIESDVTVNADKQLFSIVWHNLFSNAFKFTDKDGRVTVSLSQGKKYAVVKISDTGCGIPEEQTELIFDTFYQCDTSRSSDGNGLGLALVKRITNITNSIIKVESNLGEGTTFIVKIPK